MYCMCEYKNNKSEAFTAVISLISLYNSVACHETHMHTQTHSHTAVHVYTETRTHTHSHTHTQTSVFFAKMGGK